jgi:SAM-dependent methyltransferase
MDESLRDNQALWDAWTRIHVPSPFYDVASFRDGTNPIRLADYERDELGPVEGRTLLHLQCHFGLDTLSWARLGATVTGLDFSAEAIAAARTLAADVGLDARFVASNVYDAPDVLHETFDIVYTSRGVLGWLPDIAAWARVVARFVRPGGVFYITEIHPVAQVFADDSVASGDLRLAYPYWSHAEPLTFDAHGSYADPDAPTEGLVEHGWDHSLGEIVTALVDAGLRIELLHELPFVAWPVAFLVEGEDGRYRLPPGAKGELPLFFSLRARKPDTEGTTATTRYADAYGDATSVRRRSAGELHDVAGQSLVAAYRFVEAARSRGAAAAGSSADLDSASDQLLTAMREVRAVMEALEAPGLEDRGLAAAVRAWAERQTNAGVPIVVRGQLPRDEATSEQAWFDLVTEAALLVHRASPTAPIAIELHHDDRGRMMRVTAEGASALAGRVDEEHQRTLAWIRRVAQRLGGAADVAHDERSGTSLVLLAAPTDAGAGPEGRGDR